MAVRYRLYAPLAECLAEVGLLTLRFDYRGIGESREVLVGREQAWVHDWGELDIAGALAWLSAEAQGAPLALVGHSAGGWLPGLAPNCGELRAILTIGSQIGWAGYWPWPGRARLLFFWRVILPVAVRMWGYLPGFILGSEPIPPRVAREWAAWARHRDFVERRARETGARGFQNFRGRLRAIAVEGDFFAPEAAVRNLPRLYPNAQSEVATYAARGAGGEVPGHFNVFRQPFRKDLWEPARDWLLAALA